MKDEKEPQPEDSLGDLLWCVFFIVYALLAGVIIVTLRLIF